MASDERAWRQDSVAAPWRDARQVMIDQTSDFLTWAWPGE